MTAWTSEPQDGRDWYWFDDGSATGPYVVRRCWMIAAHKRSTHPIPRAEVLAAMHEGMRALDGILVYASDTLSGRADGAEDVDWHRAGVSEIKRRASAALRALEEARRG
jgi:hypothetical protein